MNVKIKLRFDEVWKVINDYPKYEVSNYGRVRNRKTNIIITPRITNRGYLRVALYSDNGKKYGKDITVHSLVLNAFTIKPKGNYEPDHVNLNRCDNRLENLRWVTHKENLKSRRTSRRVAKYDVKSKELIDVFETFQEAVDDSGLKNSTLRYRIYNNIPVKIHSIYKFYE